MEDCCGNWYERVSHGLGLNSAVQHAVFSGYVSVLVGVMETTMSMTAGENEDSSSLLGIAIMAIAEITGSLLVLYRWRFMSNAASASGSGSGSGSRRMSSSQREALFAGAIGVMMLVLGAMLFRTSLYDLGHQEPPGEVTAGIFVSCFGVVSSFALYVYKARVGEELKSMVLIADAKCSRCVGLISLAVILALGMEKVVWWADSLTGLFLSVYILLEGLKSIHEAYSQWTMHPWGDEGLRLVPMMHERVRGEGADEESALLQETI